MPVWSFVRETFAPDPFTLTLASGAYVFAGTTAVTTSDPQVARDLLGSDTDWVKLQGTTGGVVNPTADSFFTARYRAADKMLIDVDGTVLPVATSEAFRRALVASLDSIVVGAITRNSDGASTSAGVVWPDGATGAYASSALSTAFPGAVDAYTVTYVPAIGTTLTYTQPAVTRDSSTGGVTNRPAITVA